MMKNPALEYALFNLGAALCKVKRRARLYEGFLVELQAAVLDDATRARLQEVLARR